MSDRFVYDMLGRIDGKIDNLAREVSDIKVKCAGHDSAAEQFQRDLEDLKDRKRRVVEAGRHRPFLSGWLPFVELVAELPTLVRVLIPILIVLLGILGFHHGGR